MRCPACGNPNRDEARFCDACGAALEGAADTVAGDGPAAEGSANGGWGPSTSPAPASPLPELIGGRYRIEAPLGQGGRKRVLRARDEQHAGGREVAISIFATEGVEETVIARARREAQAMARLGEHPHIVRVLDAGEHDGVPFIVSEYVPGDDVAAVLERCEGRRLELERAVSIAADVCRALEHAHARGIVHRDLKPANVWLGEDGAARLGDFGLAATDRRSRDAVEGMLVGTVAYLPPEQALGRSSEPRSDLYSLGAMLYELCTGEPPFAGTDAVAIIGQHLSAEPPAPSRLRPELPRPLEELILSLLEKQPADRPKDARSVRLALEAIDLDAPPEEEAGESDPLESLAGGVFVGRERELEEMREALEASLGGRGRLLLLAGEPGIGKTITAEQLSTYARVRGARVHWGRCSEGGGAPPYWPFSEALRGLIGELDPVGLRWQLGGRAADVAQVVPELRELLGDDLGDSPPVESEQQRFRVFDSVAGFLARIAGTRPLVLVLDDLHWADEPSLQLLRFLARRLEGTQLLVIGTYRDVELGRHHPLAGTLAELATLDATRRLVLRGLDGAGVARYVELVSGFEPPPGLAEAVLDRTDGNPFFVAEIVRLLASEGRLDAELSRAGELAIPEGVREVVGRRLDQLPEAANEVLTLAAVCGRRFPVAVLDRICELEPGDVAAALAQAERARLIVGSREGDEYAFAHALVRETLEAELAPARRVALHRQIGEALEALHGADSERHASELAHHFLEAAGAGEAMRAIGHARRAARHASVRLAFEEAASLLRRALEALELEPGAHDALRLELLIELGEAETRAGRVRDARAPLERGAALARRLDRTEDLARIALGLCVLADAGVHDESLVSMLEEALERCGAGDSSLRAQLLSGLAQALYWQDPAGRSSELGREALAMARRVGDDAALAAALVRRQFTGWIGREETERRLRESGELHDVAKRLGDPELEIRAHAYRLRDKLELGDVRGVDAELAAFERLANELRAPQHLWHVPLLRGMRALIDGDFERAESLAEEALAGGQRAQEPVSVMFNATQRTLVRRLRASERDRRELAESLVQLAELAKRYPAIPAWSCSLAAAHATLGNEGEARAAFEQLAGDGFAGLPFDAQWVVSLALLGETASFLGDAPRSRRLYELLSPHDGLTIVTGRAAVCQGPVARVLGQLAAVWGPPELAERHLEEALALSERMGDRPFAAATRYELAQLLLARNEGPDRERALRLLAEALAGAQELGMVALTNDALAARLEAQGLGSLDATTSIDFMVEAVASEGADIASHAAPDGMVTLLFSDIEDSTAITERLGDERWLDVLRAHNSVFRRQLAAHGGTEVKNQGDGFMLVFADSRRALDCAVAIQRELAVAELGGGERLRVRMGLHAGAAIREDGDFFGRSVILAARIAAAAGGEEILVSETLRARAADDGGGEPVEFDEGRDLELKGLAGTHRVYRAEWRQPVAV